MKLLKALVWVIFVIIMVFIFRYACSGGEPDIAEAPVRILTFQGRDNAITPAFVVKGDEGWPIEFKVVWYATPKDAYFAFDVHSVSVNNPSIAGNPYKVMYGSIPVSFSHPNPFASKGEFVIEVIASSNCKWEIEIWQ